MMPVPADDRHELVLATDLDGTLLAGEPEARRRIFELFDGDRDNRKLIFVTGRGLESVLPVLANPTVPTPDWVIADAGATVVSGRSLRPVLPLQGELAKNWPGAHIVLERLAGFRGLQRQDVPQERRCSFFCDEDAVTGELHAVVEELGCELLFSAGRYLDVLPRGISKGSTLLGLAEQEGLPTSAIVVAGDTLNDLSLFETGLKGVVVGHAEAKLLDQVRDLPNVFIAEREGCGGIVDALVHHDLLDQDEHEPSAPVGGSELVMVYHRLPFDEAEIDGRHEWVRPRSPNGIIPTLLGFFAKGARGSWVAWSKQPSPPPAGFRPRVIVDAQRYPQLVASRIPLQAADVELFYNRFSKEAFWPIIFSFPERAGFDEASWAHYLRINRRFARQAAAEAAPGALVWIHDYNLWMVPAFLRQLRPDLRIAFFHHTAFPPPDVFNVIPWRRDILGSLLQCDYIGFHVPRYVENFVGAVRSYAPCEILATTSCAPRWRTFGCALGVDSMTTRLRVGERTVGVGAHPVGVDVEAIARLVASGELAPKVEAIRMQIRDRIGILSIERLDYVKGSLRKLLAFEQMLERHPELRGKVVLFNVITPAAPGMEVYESLRVQLDEAVGRINGRFSALGWTPVRYFFRSIPYDEVVAHYLACDIAWITPLRDGLNLVAKEYVATRDAAGEDGILILSEFAGVAAELHGALLTNPYDITDMRRVLVESLKMTRVDREHRMRRMASIVREGDVGHWGREFMQAVDALCDSTRQDGGATLRHGTGMDSHPRP